MSGTGIDVDPPLVDEILSDLRLPAIRGDWRMFAERSDREGWPAGHLIRVLMEHEKAGREQRRIARYLAESNLIPGKTLDSFDFKPVPRVSKAEVMAISAGGDWIKSGHNVLMFGPPGVGKSHLASAIGGSLVERGYRVLFTRTTDLVNRLRRAEQSLELEAELKRLDRHHLLILDDFSYVSKDRDQTAVLFELISARYERCSMLITANQPFSQWDHVFPDKAMTVAAVDKLIYRASVLEMNAESYRRRASARSTRSKRARSG